MNSLKKLISTALMVLVTLTAQAAEKVTYFHNDIAGTPVAATDATGNLLWTESYEPYGKEIQNSVSSRLQPISYTGKPYDDDTWLAYFGARYYDPSIGRFMAMDPVDFDPSNIHSFNKYAYGNNNPYRYLDPDGNSPLEWVYLAGDATSLVRNVATANWGGAAMDMVSIVVDAAGPPGGRTVLSLWRAGDKALDAAKGVKAAKGASTLKPGPFAKDSIPGHMGKPTVSEQKQVNALMEKNGCHTCGTTNPGTKSGNAIVDHQPAQALGETEQFLPHCIDCMRRQGGEVLQELIKRGGN